jgi:hypothetical protein
VTDGVRHTEFDAPREVDRIQQRALVVGLIGGAGCLLGAALSPHQFFRSYLIGYLFWAGITLGCLAIVMLQHLSGGGWGLVIRRLLESGTRTLPLIVVLFLPLVFGLDELYSWARGAEAATTEPLREALKHKQPYLNFWFFIARAAFYFALWGALTYFVNKWSTQQDTTDDPKPRRRLEAISGPGLILFGFSATFASIDWVMSLDPEWFSTIFGIMFMGGQALSAMAFVIAVVVVLGVREPMSRIVSPGHLHDLGKLLLAFVMLWAYFSFSQFLIIWSGNLPEEIPWYIRRLHGGWQLIGLALILFHFALPFMLLLSRDLKRSARTLAVVATAVIVMRFADLFWLIAPEFNKEAFSFHWLDIAAPAGVGGVWLWFFVHQLKQRPLMPIHDPGVQAVLEGEH